MGNRLITMALASILAAATSGMAAEKAAKKTAKAESTNTSKAEAKHVESKPAAKKTAKASKADKAKSAAKSAGKSTSKSLTKGRLPRGYGKLKLSVDQRSEVLTIQRDYQQRIEKLLAEIEQLQTRRDADFRDVLDKSQRELLHETTTKVATSKVRSKKSTKK